MNSYVVIGSGCFGASVAVTLSQLGKEVLVIDKNEDNIQKISNDVTHAIIGDVMDVNILKSAGAKNCDAAVVAIGNNMEASILVTLLLKDMGIKYILTKAQNEIHAKVLSSVGADKVVFPESDIGVRVAHNLVSSNILDYIELSPEYSIVEAKIPKSWIGKTLKELNVRVRYNINIMAIKNGAEINITPKADRLLKEQDILVIIGSNHEINALK